MKFLTLLVLFFYYSAWADSQAQDYAIDAQLGGVESAYADFVRKKTAAWNSAVGEVDEKNYVNDVFLNCFKIVGNDFFIAAKQSMIVNAPKARVEIILDDFANYSNIFDDLVRVDILQKDKNKFLTRWEQHIPFPFIPNDLTELFYVKKQTLNFSIYRYQLNKGTSSKVNDGFIALDKISETKTLYTEYDFIDADWGILKGSGAEKIWETSLRGILQSDYAIKLKAENENKENKLILKESKKFAKKWPIEECLKEKKVWAN